MQFIIHSLRVSRLPKRIILQTFTLNSAELCMHFGNFFIPLMDDFLVTAFSFFLSRKVRRHQKKNWKSPMCKLRPTTEQCTSQAFTMVALFWLYSWPFVNPLNVFSRLSWLLHTRIQNLHRTTINGYSIIWNWRYWTLELNLYYNVTNPFHQCIHNSHECFRVFLRVVLLVFCQKTV